jgi:hypothetical protein
VPTYKYVWSVWKFILANKCAMRIEIKKYLMKEFGLTMDQAEDAASSSLRALRRRGMIKRIGYGMYCVNE